MYWYKEKKILKCDLPQTLGGGSRFEISQFSMIKDSNEPFKAYVIIGGINKKVGKYDTEKQAIQACLKYIQALGRALKRTEDKIC